MVSYADAKGFLENILELPNNWEETLKRDKLEFLRLFMKFHLRRIPFQNVTMASIDKPLRKNPKEDELIKEGFSGIGGCCINLNYFAKVLFEALGMVAYAIQGTHNHAPVPGTHCMVVVKVDNGDLYLVELGGSFPILEPVPMQNLPFRILTAGGFPYEFRLTPEGLVGRYHLGGGLLQGKYVEKAEALRTSWDLKPRKYSEFDHAMQETFTNPPVSALLRNPMMFRYFYPEEVQLHFPELHADSNVDPDIFIFAWKKQIVIGDKHDRRISKNYDNYEDMAQDVAKYFPMLDKAEVYKAFKTFDEFAITPNPYDNIL